jgi:DNA-binding beta-propeller fold protein YncE
MKRTAAATVLLLCAACGSNRPPTVLHAAPEPARAPAPAVAPAGTQIDLHGGRPEGMVADPVSGLVVVALRDPNRLALVDPAAGKVLRTIPVPGSARHLELVPGGGAVLVPGEDTDLLSRVDLPSGHVSSSVTVLRQPHDVAVTDSGSEYVADEFGGAVSLVRDGSAVRTFRGLVQPGGAAGTGDTGTVVDVRARLLHVYRGDRQVGALPAGAGPTHALALTRGTVLVTDTSGGALLLYDVAGKPRHLRTQKLPGRPYGTAYDAARRRVFITATADNLLVEYVLKSGHLTKVATFPSVRDAYSVAVVPSTGRVVIAGESGSVLQLLDP